MPHSPKIDIYEKLRGYIVRSQKTQRQIADEVGIPNPSYLSHMANGRVNWVEGDYFRPLSEALSLSKDEIRQLKPEIIWEEPIDPNQSTLDLTRLGGVPINAEYPIPMLGDVAAGGRNTRFPNMESDETTDAGRELAERYGLSHLYALRVTGDSMYSERARFSVPDGSTLIIHRDLEPVRGDIVIAYIEDLDLGVVKEYGEPEDVTLSSYNPTGPLYRANQHRIRICGVVVEARSKPRTRRNGTH